MGQKLFSSSLYPRLPQAVVLYIFFYIIFALLWGPDDTAANFGLVSIWILWWPLIPVTFVLLGRGWCALCPWGALTDWLQTHLCLGVSVPRWIKKHGIWIILGGFIFLTWYELALGVTSSRLVTLAVLLTILGLAVIAGFVFEKRTWCRYLCPLGGIFGNYAQTALVELRGTPEKCRGCKDMRCVRGGSVQGCSLGEFPKKMDSNRLCNLCGDCVKNCLNNSPRLTVRVPGKELWEKSRPRLDEALLSSLLVGIILISGFGMLEFWVRWQTEASALTGLSKAWLITAAFLVFGATTFLMTYVASWFSSRSTGGSVIGNFSTFGYALIPLNLATHMAHNLFHFLGEGRNIARATMALFSAEEVEAARAGAQQIQHTASSGLAPPDVIQLLQVVLMALGLVASVHVAWHIAQRTGRAQKASRAKHAFAPHLVLILVFSAVALVMFVSPMAMRH